MYVWGGGRGAEAVHPYVTHGCGGTSRDELLQMDVTGPRKRCCRRRLLHCGRSIKQGHHRPRWHGSSRRHLLSPSRPSLIYILRRIAAVAPSTKNIHLCKWGGAAMVVSWSWVRWSLRRRWELLKVVTTTRVARGALWSKAAAVSNGGAEEIGWRRGWCLIRGDCGMIMVVWARQNCWLGMWKQREEDECFTNIWDPLPLFFSIYNAT